MIHDGLCVCQQWAVRYHTSLQRYQEIERAGTTARVTHSRGYRDTLLPNPPAKTAADQR